MKFNNIKEIVKNYTNEIEYLVIGLLLVLKSFEILNFPIWFFNIYFVLKTIIIGFSMISVFILIRDNMLLETSNYIKFTKDTFLKTFIDICVQLFDIVYIFLYFLNIISIPKATFFLFLIPEILYTLLQIVSKNYLIKNANCVSKKDFYLSFRKNTNNKILIEYNELKDALLLETNVTENKKLFKQLATEYFRLYTMLY